MMNRQGLSKKAIIFIVVMWLVGFTVLGEISGATRLPQVGGDSNVWGFILNDFLNSTLGINGTSFNMTGMGKFTGQWNFTGDVIISGLTSCDTLDTTANGTIICGTDGGGGGGNIQSWLFNGIYFETNVSGNVNISKGTLINQGTKSCTGNSALQTTANGTVICGSVTASNADTLDNLDSSFFAPNNKTLNGDYQVAGMLNSTNVNATHLTIRQNTTLNGRVDITADRNYTDSQVDGGLINVNNTMNSGAGIVVYSNNQNPTGRLVSLRVDHPNYSQPALGIIYNGSADALKVYSTGNVSGQQALDVVSDNEEWSAAGFKGKEKGHGTVKITHNNSGGVDANAAAISIELMGYGTLAQGIYMYTTGSGTGGNFLSLNNNISDVITRVVSIDWLGRVGIGRAASTTDNLTVNGTIGTYSNITFRGPVADANLNNVRSIKTGGGSSAFIDMLGYGARWFFRGPEGQNIFQVNNTTAVFYVPVFGTSGNFTGNVSFSALGRGDVPCWLIKGADSDFCNDATGAGGGVVSWLYNGVYFETNATGNVNVSKGTAIIQGAGSCTGGNALQTTANGTVVCGAVTGTGGGVVPWLYDGTQFTTNISAKNVTAVGDQWLESWKIPAYDVIGLPADTDTNTPAWLYNGVIFHLNTSTAATSKLNITTQGNISMETNMTIRTGNPYAFTIEQIDGTDVVRVDSTNDIVYTGLIRGKTDNAYDLGLPGGRWNDLFLGGNLAATDANLGWTNLTEYPTGCSAGQFISSLGDTPTCGTPTDTDTNTPAFLWDGNTHSLYTNSSIQNYTLNLTSSAKTVLSINGTNNSAKLLSVWDSEGRHFYIGNISTTFGMFFSSANFGLSSTNLLTYLLLSSTGAMTIQAQTVVNVLKPISITGHLNISTYLNVNQNFNVTATGNVSSIGDMIVNLTKRFCLNTECSSYITNNGTDSIWV